MIFRSILYARLPGRPAAAPVTPPPYFRDLNLGRIVDTVTANYEAYDLKPFFYGSLQDANYVLYRQEIFRDMEDPRTYEAVERFAAQMRNMHSDLAAVNELHHIYQKEAWLLDAVDIYCGAVLDLADSLASSRLASRGLRALSDYLTAYTNTDPLTALVAETKALKDALAKVKYCLLFGDSSIKVRKYESETDYSAEITETFERFKEGAAKEYQADSSSDRYMNHVKEGVLDRVARLYPDTFASLDDYYSRNTDYVDDTIARFDREVHFYIAYLKHIETLKLSGLAFCYPRVSEHSKDVRSVDGFDLALANALVRQHKPVVCNDFHLDNDERIVVVTGPNQGGKTTFARTFGQLHHLGSTGCPVPGREAQLLLFDNIFTHFEREETVASLRSKLEDDLIRIHRISSAVTPWSIVILNEIFTSTTLGDSIFLSTKIMEKLLELEVLGVWVTFIDELSSFGEQTVSMVGAVVPENPAVRTYKIRRRPADGLAYAWAIAEKHGLSYERLKERLKP